MKILKEDKKLFEDITESEAEDIAITDVKHASMDDIADSVQDAAEVASDGKETFSDKKADQIAKEIKTLVKGLDRSAWAPLDVENELTKTLDFCLSQALIAKKQKRRDGTDLIVTGLPGSGKTGITKAWADARGINLFSLKAMNSELDAILNGFPVDTIETDENGVAVHKVVKSRSTILDPLEEPNSVLFLDEYNRAPDTLRANLLTLINEHEVEAATGQGKKGMYRFENLLFTIACINPAVATDMNADELNSAEMTRYTLHMDYDSNKADALAYIPWHIRTSIDGLDKSDPDYAFLYMDLMKKYNLALYILKHRKFRFDDREDDKACGKAKPRRMLLNQRILTDGIMAAGSDKATFLWWVDTKAKFLDKNKVMFHEILDSWVEPVVAPPTDAIKPDSTEDSSTDDSASQVTASSAAVDNDTEFDYDALLSGGGIETDTGFFSDEDSSGTSSSTQIDYNQAAQNLANMDMTL